MGDKQPWSAHVSWTINALALGSQAFIAHKAPQTAPCPRVSGIYSTADKPLHVFVQHSLQHTHSVW